MKTSKPLTRKTPLVSKILPRRVVELKSRGPIKSTRPKSTPTRNAAKGMECQVRVPGICTFDTEKTVLAHYRLAGYCGTGVKPPDSMGAISCSACHDAVDGRLKTRFTHDALRLMHAEGVMRTQELLKEAA